MIEEGQKPRFFLRLANWLHLNRGKKAWSYVADTYAVILLFLASSGLFMIPGKKGIKGRGASSRWPAPRFRCCTWCCPAAPSRGSLPTLAAKIR